MALANYIGAEPNNRENFWWSGNKEFGQPNSKTVKISAKELFSQSPAKVPVAVDPTTLDKKVLFGYQGWFVCPGDGSDRDSWHHWFFGDQAVPEGLSVDYWPDMSELIPEERFVTEMTLPDGSPAEVYSNYIRKTTIRHFKWLEDYDLDGVFAQRSVPANMPANTSVFCFTTKVLQNVRAGAEAHGRVFSMELGGIDDPDYKDLDDIKNDWIFLVDVLKITESPNYLHHKGKPLLCIWGWGLYEWQYARYDSLRTWLQEDADPRYQATVMGQAIYQWREHNADTQTCWYPVYRSLDVISPWAVGAAFKDSTGADWYKRRYIIPDMEETLTAGADYMPVIYPGFSWHNIYQEPLNAIQRNGGKLLWRQVYNAISANANMIFVAMFDEVDEGTAMFKLAPTAAELPVGAQLVPLDMDGYSVPSDWYLQLARETGRMLRGEIPLSPEFPLDLPIQE